MLLCARMIAEAFRVNKQRGSGSTVILLCAHAKQPDKEAGQKKARMRGLILPNTGVDSWDPILSGEWPQCVNLLLYSHSRFRVLGFTIARGFTARKYFRHLRYIFFRFVNQAATKLKKQAFSCDIRAHSWSNEVAVPACRFFNMEYLCRP